MSRLLFVSGQTPTRADGSVPDGFEAQCRQAWANVTAVLRGAGMGLTDLVQVRVYLADREDRETNAEIGHEVLGAHRTALTVVVAGIWDGAWLLEIEAVAAE